MSDAQSPTEGQDDPGRIRRMVGDAQEQVREARVRGLGATARIPEKIGRYRILGVEGRGGMGVVYRAEQSQPRRIVALKVISPHHLSPNSLRRFFYEAESLGRLQHPGIARFYEADAAQTALGSQPFFAMELVDGGISLTQYAKQHRLNVQARLELMVKVCDAVHHAHQKGVIHRDLKPANILVDETGQPKILDFGVARIIEHGEHEGPTRTLAGQLIGTLPYMSPEQCAADPDEVDIRTDIYALGVIAYELLADRHPHDVEKTPMLEAARIIREHDPTPLGAINRVYRGDIETIVAKALNRDKINRYQSALEFAADIGRYLSDEPIAAQPAGTVYQLRKFVARNRALVSSVVVAFVAISVGLGLAIAGWIQAGRRADEALLAQQQAQAEATRARVTTDFLRSTLLMADPSVMANPDYTFREAVDRAAASISELRDHPLVEAEVRTTLGFTYRRLGNFEKAEVHLREALTIRQRQLDDSHIDLAKSLQVLAQLERRYCADYAEAEHLMRQALAIARRHPDLVSLGYPYSFDLPFMLLDLAAILRLRGRLDEAEQMARESLAWITTHLERVGRRLMEPHAKRILAEVLRDQHDLTTAAELCNQAMSVYLEQQSKGDDRAHNICTIQHTQASISQRLADWETAESLYRQVLSSYRGMFGAIHPRIADALAGLCEVLLDTKRPLEALSAAKESYDIRRQALHPDHWHIAYSRMLVGRCLVALREFQQAEDLLLQSYPVLAQKRGAQHHSTCTALQALVKLYQEWGKPQQAAKYAALAAQSQNVHKKP